MSSIERQDRAGARSADSAGSTGHAAGSRVKRVKARLRHAAFTGGPQWLARGRLSHSRSLDRIHLVERDLMIPALPEALDGLAVTHLSDFHTGKLLTPAQLPRIVDQANGLGGDLMAVTGDLVDLKLKRIVEPLIEALKHLEAPLGVYYVMGNHDYLDHGPRLIEALRDAGLGLLVNETVSVTHEGCEIEIGGIDYAHKKTQLAGLVRQTLSPNGRGNGRAGARREKPLRVLLSHHPDAFDAACRRGVQLTLSGHTHGGQMNFTNKRGKKGSVGLGSLAFKYPGGLYRRGGDYLHVTTGLGSWFPVRLRCPAEIAKLTLRHGEPGADEMSHP